MKCPTRHREAKIKLDEAGGIANCSLWADSEPDCRGECLFAPLLRDVMQRDVISVRETMPVAELARLLCANNISGVPVVDDQGRLLGVVSSRDVTRTKGTCFYDDPLMVDEFLDSFVPEPQARVGDVMTPANYKLDESASLTEALDMMLEARVHRVVVTRGEELAGIVTTTDLLKVLAGILHG